MRGSLRCFIATIGSLGGFLICLTATWGTASFIWINDGECVVDLTQIATLKWSIICSFEEHGDETLEKIITERALICKQRM